MDSNPVKQVWINGERMLYGTSAKASPETNVSTTQTFDGAINQGMADIPWSVELSKMRYDDLTTHRKLSKTLEQMLEVPAMVTIRETIQTADETYTVVDNFHNCILDRNDYELKPDDNTAENINFKASKRVRQYEDENGNLLND